MTDKAKKNFEWLYRALIIAISSATLINVVAFAPKAIDAINNRTFDSESQKFNVLNRVEVISPVEKERIMLHLFDRNLHMSTEEKEQLIIIRENQKRIGGDLEEIKNMLKRLR